MGRGLRLIMGPLAFAFINPTLRIVDLRGCDTSATQALLAGNPEPANPSERRSTAAPSAERTPSSYLHDVRSPEEDAFAPDPANTRLF